MLRTDNVMLCKVAAVTSQRRTLLNTNQKLSMCLNNLDGNFSHTLVHRITCKVSC